MGQLFIPDEYLSTRELTVEASTLTVSQLHTSSGADASILTKKGAGTLVISGAATSNWTNGVRLEGGTLLAGHRDAFGTGYVWLTSGSLGANTDLSGLIDALPNTTQLRGDAGVTGSNNLEIIGSFTHHGGDRTLTNTIEAGKTFTLSGDLYLSDTTDGRTMTLAGAGHTVISGSISDSSSEDPADPSGLTIAGPGTVELTGNNTYTGATAVNAGRLMIEGTHSGTAAITVANGAAIGGAGSLAGDLTLEEGAQLVFTGMTMNVSGEVSLHSSFGIGSLIGLDADTEIDEYILLAGSPTDFSELGIQDWGIENAVDIGGGKKAYFDTGSLTLVVIPEPHTLGLLLAAGALLAARRRTAAR